MDHPCFGPIPARDSGASSLEFLANRGGTGEIIALGDGSSAQKALGEVPSDLTFDRVYVHGDPRVGQRRGIALNSARTTISNSFIADIKTVGQDSQAIAGWNGPGDYVIENNYLEAAGKNILFGGADPMILNLTPAHILIRDNTISKPLAWREAGSAWQVKNLFELKNARDVTVEHNLLEHNWQQAQSGYAVLITVRNQDGRCPWCQVENVRFRQNVVRDVAAGVEILGIDPNHPSRQTNAIVIDDNLFDGIDSRRWGGDGYFLQITDTPRDISIDHNTIIQGASNGLVKMDRGVEGLVFTNNLASHGMFGIIGSSHGIGNDSIKAYCPDAIITGNVMAGGSRAVYPLGNFFPAIDEFRKQFVDFAGHDFRLVPGGAWSAKAADGRSLGADVSRLQVTSPLPSRGRQ